MAAYLGVWISLTLFMIAVNFQCIDGQNSWESEKKYAASKHLVTNLPGQPEVEFNQYSGYVTVNEEHGRALFYWFFEAALVKEEKPLVLWLNGGPGCSSVGYGATQEIGPFLVDGNGTGLIFNKFSWNQEANLLFVESPVGVGFSYSNTSSDYYILGDNITASDTYIFLQNWFKSFPEYRRHDFYIAGESYAGKYVPELAELIYDLNNASSPTYINLKGFMVGNPETDDGHDLKGFVDYAWSHAIVSDETHRMIKKNCDFYATDAWSNQNCKATLLEVFNQYNEIDIFSLYTPTCIHKNSTPPSTMSEAKKLKYSSTMRPSKMLAGYDPCLDDHAKIYYNRHDVQTALHATKGSQLKNWSICSDDISNNWQDSRFSVLPIYKKLIAAGFRIWVYSGDTDGRVPVISTRYCLNSLELPTRGSWRPWYHNEQVGGWIQDYEGLTFATFRGAGHAVPLFKPSSALAFFRSYLAGTSLPDKR